MENLYLYISTINEILFYFSFFCVSTINDVELMKNNHSFSTFSLRFNYTLDCLLKKHLNISKYHWNKIMHNFSVIFPHWSHCMNFIQNPILHCFLRFLSIQTKARGEEKHSATNRIPKCRETGNKSPWIMCGIQNGYNYSTSQQCVYE